MRYVRNPQPPRRPVIRFDLSVEIDLGAPVRLLRRRVGRLVTSYRQRRAERAIARFREIRRASWAFEQDWTPLLEAADHDEGLAPEDRAGLWRDYWRGQRELREREKKAAAVMWRACVGLENAGERVGAKAGRC